MTDGIAGSRQDQQAVARGGLADPFAYLGLQGTAGGQVIRVFLPGATSVTAVARKGGMTAKLQSFDNGLFGGAWGGGPYLLRIEWPHSVQETEDPFSFGPVLDDDTLSRFSNGALHDLADHLGAIPRTIDGIEGVTFAVWAPNAKRVSVVGDFNGWDGRRHPMRLRYPSGVWEIFIPRLRAGDRYKFELLDRNGTLLPPKADPIARATERPPATSSRIAARTTFAWQDDAWMSARSEIPATRQPISIYEVHAASWVRPTGNPHGELDWASLAERLVPYAQRLGFTHVELLPIMEHPFGGSWGYQPLSQFAPSARFGDAAGFAGFVDACHRGGIGVILDWVPAHFPGDPHGLALFDGTALYEHADPREGFHPDWNTYIFNLGRAEVQSFLVSSALYWLRQFHVDGLRVDAVASMLYRDYSRKAGEWTPNIHGGRENLESVAFLKQLNQAVAAECPGALMIAEESTAWPGVSAPVNEGGLGFSFKWNMGWMHDTLTYAGEDPIHRRWHHGEMTFGLVYAFSERFVLPISHDEVVHGKGSLYGRMPGDDWQKRAGLRAYLGFMWTHPGKKLLFMGSEFGQPTEWNHDAELSWDLLQQPGNEGIQHWVADINELYRREPALHESDADPAGFAWVVGDDSQNSVFAFLRRSGDRQVLVVLNFTPVPRHDYRVGVPISGAWALKLNGDDLKYGGSGISPSPMVQADAISVHGFPQSLSLTLPPLAALVFACP